MATSGILAGQVGDVLWLSVDAKGCFLNSADVENYIDQQVRAGQRRIVVDLQRCQGLDSTFMGMLIGLAKRMAGTPGGSLQIINAQNRNGQLLRGLGVHYFCEVTDGANGWTGTVPDGAPEESLVPQQTLSKRERTEHCLKAHEGLAECSDENQKRFQDVIDLMREDLAAEPTR